MPQTQESTPKSIVDPKYRNKYKGKEKDFLGKFIDAEATKYKDRTITEVVGEEKQTRTEKRPDGVDTEALVALAKANGINTSKYEGANPGRLRMTVGNLLRSTVKQRHGLFNKGGTFNTAPRDYLDAIGAGEKPTHKQDGTKIEVPKVAKAEEPAAAPPAKEAPKATGKKAAAKK